VTLPTSMTIIFMGQKRDDDKKGRFYRHIWLDCVDSPR
jgi:hypothetical protein